MLHAQVAIALPSLVSVRLVSCAKMQAEDFTLKLTSWYMLLNVDMLAGYFSNVLGK